MGTYQRPALSRQHNFQQGKTLGIQLRKNLKDAGCFRPAPVQQILHMIWVTALYAASYLLLLTQPGLGARMACLVLLAFASVQAGYIAHEAGHKAITRRVGAVSTQVVKIILRMRNPNRSRIPANG